MKEINWNRFYGILFKYGGLSIIVLSGIALFHRWYFLGIITQQDLLGISPSFSIGIAVFALGLSFESTDRMVSISNANFLEIYHNFEDIRIQLVQHPDWLGIEGTVWKCKKYIDWATELKRWAKKDYQEDLANQFILLYEKSGVPWQNQIVTKNDIKNMIKMHDSLIKFNVSDEKKEKIKKIETELNKLL
jgi:hypothetical protein